MTRARVGVLISGGGSNLQALLDAAAAPDYPAEIALVLSNRQDAYGLTRAATAGVPARVIEHGHYPDRAAFDAAMHAALLEAKVEYVCLAGFMRLLTAEFVEAWQGRMLNIHPSLLPSYKGLHTHRRVIEDGVKISGCTVHLVTSELDAGPILVQAAVPVLEQDTPETLQQRIHTAEHRIYPQALRLLAEGRVTLEGNRARIRISADDAGDILISPPALR